MRPAKALAAPGYNKYQILGTVTTGMDVVDAIAACRTPTPSIPTNPIAMTKVTVTNP